MGRRRLYRAAGGRFRGPSLADFGFGCCEVCGAIGAVRFPDPGPSGFVDPRAVVNARRFCTEHGGGIQSQYKAEPPSGGA